MVGATGHDVAHCEPPGAEAPRAERLRVSDMAPLIERLRRLVEGFGGGHLLADGAPFDRAAFARESGFGPSRGRAPTIVVGADVALELGAPTTASACAVLVTAERSSILPGRITRLGPELAALGPGRHPFAQLVLVHVPVLTALPDPFLLDRAQFLINRLPGYMVRSVPGRLWVRLSRAALARGLGFEWVGRALIGAFADELGEVASAEVLFVVGELDAVRAVQPICAEAAILAGRHKKLSLAPDGELECADLDCDGCDEQPVCEALRDVVVKRRRKRS